MTSISTFQCHCGAVTQIQHDTLASLLASLREIGWVWSPPDPRHESLPLTCFCSVACQNVHVREAHEDRHPHFIWRAFGSLDAPPCHCTIVHDERGVASVRRADQCAYHDALDAMGEARRHHHRRLVRLWQSVPQGTPVFDRARRMRGRTNGVPKLVVFSDGATMPIVPVAGWRPHAHLGHLDFPIEVLAP